MAVNPAADPVSVTEAERRDYNATVGAIFKRRVVALRPEAPDVLWHYTTGANLIAILQSGKLWSTQVACLNDRTEYRYAVSLTADAFRRRERLAPDETFVRDRVVRDLSSDDTDSRGLFVACFSERPDDLSQWRAYSGGEGGYSLGFRGRDLVNPAPRGTYLAPVIYDAAQQSAIVDEIVEATFDKFAFGLAARGGNRETWINAFLPAWAEAVIYLAPLLKHRAFADEREWRLIRHLRPGDVVKLEFRQRQSMLRRHFPLAFAAATGDTPPPLPLAQIIVGPSRHMGTSRVGVGDLLLKAGYAENQVPVTLSEAPYQAI